MIILSPNPEILPSKASTVFFILEIARFNSIISFAFNCLKSITAIVYPSLNAFKIGVMSSKLFKIKGLTRTLDLFRKCAVQHVSMLCSPERTSIHLQAEPDA